MVALVTRRTNVIRLALAALVTLAASFQSLDGRSAAVAATNPCGLQPAPPTTYSHVVVIMEENLAYASAIGNANAPYLNMLASVCALATNFHNETHPSQPNYMAATSGFVTGVSVHSPNPSIYQQAETWNDLEESMGGNCGASATHYKRGHDPALLVHADRLGVQGERHPDDRIGRRCDHLAHGGLHLDHPAPAPQPSLGERMHRGVQAPGSPGDGHVACGTIQAIQATADYQAGQTLIFVTFDEGQGGTNGRTARIRRTPIPPAASSPSRSPQVYRRRRIRPSTPTTPCFAPRRRRSPHHHVSGTPQAPTTCDPEWASRLLATRSPVAGRSSEGSCGFMTNPDASRPPSGGRCIPRTRYKRLPMHGGKAATSDIFGGDRPPYRPRTYHNSADGEQRIHCRRRFANCDRARPARERRRVQATLSNNERSG